MKDIAKEEFEAWLANPVTQAFREYCTSRAEYLATAWREGAMNAGTVEAIALVNLEQSSAAQVFDRLAEMNWTEIQEHYTDLRNMRNTEEESDDESDETET